MYIPTFLNREYTCDVVGLNCFRRFVKTQQKMISIIFKLFIYFLLGTSLVSISG